MELGRDWDSVWKNMWPMETDAPGFKDTMLAFYQVGRSKLSSLANHVPQTCHDLHINVMRSVALGLNLNEHFFDSKIDQQCHNLRLLSYPPIKRVLLDGEGQARAGAHSGEARPADFFLC